MIIDNIVGDNRKVFFQKVLFYSLKIWNLTNAVVPLEYSWGNSSVWGEHLRHSQDERKIRIHNSLPLWGSSFLVNT